MQAQVHCVMCEHMCALTCTHVSLVHMYVFVCAWCVHLPVCVYSHSLCSPAGGSRQTGGVGAAGRHPRCPASALPPATSRLPFFVRK